MLTGTLSAPDPAVGHSHPHTSTSCTLTGKSGSVIAPFSESWCAQGLVCALQESVSPVLCKFWQLYDRVNGDLFREDLCHTQVCCTQSPCRCGSPLLTCTFSGDTQTLKGKSGSVSGGGGSPGTCNVLFEHCKHL